MKNQNFENFLNPQQLSFKLPIIIWFYNIKKTRTINFIQYDFQSMDQFNNDCFDSDSQNYYYQQSSNDVLNTNFIYQDSCAFFHDYKHDQSYQEQLLPKQTQKLQEVQESQPSISCFQAYDETLTQREQTEKVTLRHFKHKFIEKPPKKNTQISKNQNYRKGRESKAKQGGNKSKFNNFGGFLIGSLAEILLKSRAQRISNSNYEILSYGQYIPIFKSNFVIQEVQSDRMMSIIRKLKKEIWQIPRKQGAKKHLFRLINKGAKENDEKKECKRMIRQELIYYLSQQDWLIDHVNSRDFQPKDDDEYRTKKKERHEAYLIYLRAIRQALITKEQLPKRLAL